MNAKMFRVSKWIAFGISCITTGLFVVSQGTEIGELPPEFKLFLWALGALLAWLFNAAEQGLLRQYLFPLIAGKVWSRSELPVLILIPVFILDALTTRSGLRSAGLGEAVSLAAGLVLPWAFELFAELETRAGPERAEG